MKMTKARAEKRILFLYMLIRKTWFKYLDSLDNEGNEKAKQEGYLSLAIFRANGWFNSYNKEEDMKKENQVHITVYNHGGKYEVDNS